jgi:ABC-type glycerol-3-phosphate transport system substrate-binding protein
MAQSSNVAKRIRRILDIGQSRRSLTRTRSVSMLLLLAIALLPLSTMQLSRASAQNTDITLTVTFPAWQTPGRNGTPTGDAFVDDFERAHPGVKVAFVEAVDVPDPVDGIDAYFTAVQKAATTSDLVLTDNAGFPMAVTPQSTRAGYFLDLTPLIAADSSLKVDDFYPQVWKSFQWDHGMWAIPYSLDLAVLNYNKEFFDKAGIAYPSGKWTLDDFGNAATKLTLKDASGNRTQSGYAGGEYIWSSGNAALKQGLIGDTNLYDQTNIPGQPQFSNPKVEAVVDTWQQLTQQGAIAGVPVTAAMYVDNLGHMLGRPDYKPTYSLLPGNKAGLFVQGFGISAGSQHPELAYALAVYLTNKAENDAYFGIPARKTLKPASWYDDAKTFIDEAMPNGLPYSDMLLTTYLNTAWSGNVTNAKDAVQGAEQRALNDLKAADARKGTLTLTVKEPSAPVLAPGKVALKFTLSTTTDPNATRDQWDRVVQEFTAGDPQAGLIDVGRTFVGISQAVANSDCFYLPTNQVPMITGDTVLDLTPFMNADTSFDKNDVVGNVLTQVQRDNKTYALPISIQPLVLQYDPAKFSAANVTAPANDWKVEAFADALRTLKQNGPGAFVDIESNGTYLLVLIADYGGLPLDYRTNPPTVNFTDPATVTAIQQVLDLARNGPFVSPDENTAISPVLFDATSAGAAKKTVLFPTGNKYTGLAYTLGTAYISTKSKNPDACYRFISTLAKHPELFSAMPVRRSLLNSAELKATTNPDVIALYNQVDTVLKDSHTIPIPSFNKGTVTISDYLLQNWLFEAFDTYVANGSDLGMALKNAEGYAKTYQGCAQKLPPTLLSGEPTDTTRAYADCAVTADNRLKSMFGQ